MLHKIGIVALCILLVLISLCGCKPEEPTDWTEEPADETAGYRRTVLYYQSDDGFLVPVMKLLPWEEGIGQAALNQLVDTAQNRQYAAEQGLKNTIPDGVSFTLTINDDALATVNLSDLPKLENAEAEKSMVCSIVNTLTEFPTIDQVQLTFDGKVKKKLPNGTIVKSAMRAQPLNEEPLAVNASEDAQHKLTLYFPNQQASLNVPITRYTQREPSFCVAMEELVKGPANEQLRNCFPEGTEVLSASVTGETATVNFSSEFATLSERADWEQAAIETIQLTAQQFGDVSQISIQVEGEDYQASEQTIAMPMFANQWR